MLDLNLLLVYTVLIISRFQYFASFSLILPFGAII